MKLNISLAETIKKIIDNDPVLGNLYKKVHPHTKYSLDDILDELLYFLKTGCSWCDLRSKINKNTLYWHFHRFSENNIFLKTFHFIRDHYLKICNSSIQIIDTTCIWNKFGCNRISRNKFYKNKNCNKISLITDSFGIPLSAILDSGNIHDLHFISPHIDDLIIPLSYIKNKTTLLADKGYVSKKHKEYLSSYNYDIVYPMKKNMKTNLSFDKKQYKLRINIEHTFSKLKSFKHIQMRYDKYFSTYSSFVFFALSILISRNL